jgi:hypothetical protein
MKTDRSPEPSQSPPPHCLNTGEQGQHEEISDGDPGDGGDSNGADEGVLASLGEGLPSAEAEHECLVSLLSSIDG